MLLLLLNKEELVENPESEGSLFESVMELSCCKKKEQKTCNKEKKQTLEKSVNKKVMSFEMIISRMKDAENNWKQMY